MYYILASILGLFLGSFLACASYRLSIGQGINNPKRSYCDNCKHELKWYDLIPVLSFMISSGKCRYCGIKMSILYPISEILCSLLFLTCYKVFGLSYETIIAMILSSLLIMVIVSDISFLIIPDEVIISVSVFLIITTLIFKGVGITILSILYGIIMFFVMYLIMLLGNFVFKKETLGGADIKLMFISGFVLSGTNLNFANIFDFLLELLPSFFTIFFASIIALPVSIILYLKNKEHVIAYGPFLVLSMLFLYIFQVDITKIIDFFTLV